MSKLDDAFLKAYAKVRTPAQGQSGLGSENKAEPNATPQVEGSSEEEIWIDRDGIRVVLPDEGIVNVASFIARTSSGRTRGTSTRGGGGVPSGDTPKPSVIPDHEDLFSSETKTMLVDGAHALQGPHFNPVSVDLAALDQLAPTRSRSVSGVDGSTMVADAPYRGPTSNQHNTFTPSISSRPEPSFSGEEHSRALNTQSLNTQTVDTPTPSSTNREAHVNPQDESAAKRTPTTAQDIPEVLRMPANKSDKANRQVPEPFISAWEVDRFEFEPVICELSAESSPLWGATEQLQNACRDGLRVLAVASPTRGQGRSTLAITLAKMLSSTGMSVALVDGDLDHPSIAEKLSLDIRLGWNDATRTGIPVEEVAVQSIDGGLTVLPLASPDASKSPRPSAEGTTQMLSRLRDCFDLVILDTAHMNIIGGWLPGTDSPCQIDAALVIDDLRHDDAEAMQACLRRLQKLGIEHVGLVENFAA